VNQVVADPVGTGKGLGLVLLGLPVYHLRTRTTSSKAAA
jgi:hypothetical protein